MALNNDIENQRTKRNKVVPCDCDKPLTTMVRHFVSSKKQEEFHQWNQEITALVSSYPGFMDKELIQPVHHTTDQRKNKRDNNGRDNDQNDEDDDDYDIEYVCIFRFDTYEHLRQWMESNDRKQIVAKVGMFSPQQPDGKAKEPVYAAYHSLEHWFLPSKKKGIQNATKAVSEYTYNCDDEEYQENNENTVHDGYDIGTSQQQLQAQENRQSKPTGGPPAQWKMVIVTTFVIYTQLMWVPVLANTIFPNGNETSPQGMNLLVTFMIVLVVTYVVFPLVTRLLAFWLFPHVSYKEKLLELVPSFLKRKEISPGHDERKDLENTKSKTEATITSTTTKSVLDISDTTKNRTTTIPMEMREEHPIHSIEEV